MTAELIEGGGVLVVGDANPDLVLTGDVVPRFGQAEQLLTGADLVLGGSAAITACGLARLGVPTVLAAVVGRDVFGDFVVEHLTAAGVRTDQLLRSAEPTGLSVILDVTHDRSILTRLGTIPLLRGSDVRQAVAEVEPAHVHVASYFLQPRLAADLPELLRWIRGLGVTTSLDTNADPAGRWAGLGDVLPLIDVLLPNGDEALAIAAALAGEPVDDLDAAAAILVGHGPRVVIKNGAAGGVSYATDGSAVTAPGLDLDVVDSTGAGDSFDAGYLAALLNGITDEAVRVRWAAVAGSLSVRGHGGTGRQADRAELLAVSPHRRTPW